MDKIDYPSFILKNSNKKDQKNDRNSQESSEFEDKSFKLRSFGRTYRSVSPLIVKSLKVSKSGDPRKELARLTTAQNKIFKNTLKYLNIESSNEISDQTQNELLQSISELIATSNNLNNTRLNITFLSKSIALNIDQFLKEKKDIVSERDIYLIADNNKNNLKVAGLRGTLDFYETLSSLLMNNQTIKRALKQQIELSILMAKDVCFNHDPKASLWDREILFISLIEPCMNLVKDSWLSLLNNKFPDASSSKIYVNSVIAKKLNQTKKSINELDMGHGNNIDFTLEDISRAYSPLIDFLTNSNINYNLKSKIIDLQILLLDDLLSKSWDLTVNDIKEYLNGLAESDVNLWIENEGSKPMDLSKLEAFFDFDHFKDKKEKIFEIEFDDKDLAGESFYRLIQAWGLTDSLCKIKK